MKLDHPDGGFIPSGCSCSSGNDSASVVEAMSMIGSITSVAGGQHESHEYRESELVSLPYFEEMLCVVSSYHSCV